MASFGDLNPKWRTPAAGIGNLAVVEKYLRDCAAYGPCGLLDMIRVDEMRLDDVMRLASDNPSVTPANVFSRAIVRLPSIWPLNPALRPDHPVAPAPPTLRSSEPAS